MQAIDELAALGAATVYESCEDARPLDPALRAPWDDAHVCGWALTVRCAVGDNLALHHALAKAIAGQILVVDAGGDVRGYWGEVLSSAAIAAGVRGLVIDGGIRDVAAQRRHGFAAWARGRSIESTIKRAPGSVGEPITCGGAEVATGDLVVADADGVVVVPKAAVDATLRAAPAHAAMEAGWLRSIADGALTLDLLGLR